MDEKTIRVEVVHADPRGQIARVVDIAADATVEQAVLASAIREALPADSAFVAMGIFGRVVAPDAPLREGDRIELYRPLKIDPKQARRRRAVRENC